MTGHSNMSSINTVISEHMQQTTYKRNREIGEEQHKAFRNMKHRREGGWKNTAERHCNHAGSQPSQEDINFLKKRLEVAESSNLKLHADLQVAIKEGKEIKNYVKFQEVHLFEVDKKCEGLSVSVKFAQVERDNATAELQQRCQLIVPLQQCLLQTENRVKVQEKKMEEVCRLDDLVREKKWLSRVNTLKHKKTLCKLADTKSALDVTEVQCHTLEERLKWQLAQRDECHLQEPFQNEGALRKGLFEQERFQKELAEQRGRFEQKLADLEGNMARQLSEEEESHKKIFSEQEERLNKILSDTEEDMKKQLLEREKSFLKELSDRQELAELQEGVRGITL